MFAQTVTANQPSTRDPYATFIDEASQLFGIPARWIGVVMDVESAGRPNSTSTAGAMGLMQVMPDTWDELRRRHHLGTDPYDPHDNILAGAAYLREMFDRYGTIAGMLAAYNAGPARYDAYLTTGQALPIETQVYVALLTGALDDVGFPDSGDLSRKPTDWRGASLFTGLANGEPVAVPLQSTGRTSATSSIDHPRLKATCSRHKNALFVSNPAKKLFP